MTNGLGVILRAVTAFTATNLDDILVLLLFFSQAVTVIQKRRIVVGQYIGFTVIILVSLPGFFSGLIVPKPWLGLLGLLPISVGVKQLWELRQQGLTELSEQELSLSNSTPQPLKAIAGLLHPQTYNVAAVTLANGGDNFSIYIPLFAGVSLTGLGLTLSVFYLLVGVWCGLGDRLSRQPHLARLLTRHGQIAVPFVLIGLGLMLIYERGTLALWPRF